MATVKVAKKACAVNPLKMSQPIGGAFAFMGLRGSMPLLHGSQGCTSFGLTLFVRHFKEAVPMQTTAMSAAKMTAHPASMSFTVHQPRWDSD